MPDEEMRDSKNKEKISMPNFVVKKDGTDSMLVLNGGCVMNKPVLTGQLLFCGKGKSILVFREHSERPTDVKVMAGMINNPNKHWLKSGINCKTIEPLLELNSDVSFETFSVLLRVLDSPAEDQPAKFLMEIRKKGITEEDITSAFDELAGKFT